MTHDYEKCPYWPECGCPSDRISDCPGRDPYSSRWVDWTAIAIALVLLAVTLTGAVYFISRVAEIWRGL